MFRRLLREIKILTYMIKRDAIRRWNLDTPSGVMGIIALLMGIGLLVIVGQSVATVFRAMIPWVSGGRISDVYWASIGFGIKISFALLGFIVSFLIYFIYRLKNKP